MHLKKEDIYTVIIRSCSDRPLTELLNELPQELLPVSKPIISTEENTDAEQ